MSTSGVDTLDYRFNPTRAVEQDIIMSSPIYPNYGGVDEALFHDSLTESFMDRSMGQTLLPNPMYKDIYESLHNIATPPSPEVASAAVAEKELLNQEAQRKKYIVSACSLVGLGLAGVVLSLGVRWMRKRRQKM